MKKRRTLIISLMLVAALCLGIGYAGLVDDLIIKGNANLDPSVAAGELDADVKFIDATGDGTYCSAVVDTTDPTGDTVFIQVGGPTLPAEMAVPEQVATATMVIENKYESDVQVSIHTESYTGFDKFNVNITFPDGDIIEAGGTLEVEISISLKDILDTAINTDFSVTLHAETVNGTP